MPTYKKTILGRKIDRAAALEGLGDIANWEKEAETLERQFYGKPGRTITPQRSQAFNLPDVVVSALRTAGIRPVQTRNLTDAQLRKVAGIGPSRIKEIRKKVGRGPRGPKKK